MEKKKEISRYRERLDKTLSSAELTDTETIKTLVKNQILRYGHDEKEVFSDDLLDKKARELSNLLDMLRSTSIDDHQVSESSEASHGEWKLKQDTEEFRVMYREGPRDTPFHTLLVEGYVDGPLDVCLCISWESSLYKKWWPQSSFPPFKVNTSTCLQKVRIGEQISLVRMKVAWPLSAREALVHFFFIEYLQDDLIVVLINTISDVSGIDKATHGFTNDGIPEAKDVVRIDMVGGFALQKVNDERSYFRTIATMDMKLDFVPPSLINFISRQLVGNSFRLYQKTVASVSNRDEDYSKALADPLYAMIREALNSSNKSGETLEAHEHESKGHVLRNENLIEGTRDDTHDIGQKGHLLQSENLIEGTQDDTHDIGQKVHANDHAIETPPRKEQDTKRKGFGEIEEESEESTCPEEVVKATNQCSINKFSDVNGVNAKRKIHIRPEVEDALTTLERKIHIRPEVEDALTTLEKVISVVRKHGLNALTSSSDEETSNLEESALNNLVYAADNNVYLKAEVKVEATSEQFAENQEVPSGKSRNSSDINDMRYKDSNSFAREVNHNKVVPASPQPKVSNPMETRQVALSSYGNETIKVNGFDRNGLNEAEKLSNRRKHRLCCFGFSSG